MIHNTHSDVESQKSQRWFLKSAHLVGQDPVWLRMALLSQICNISVSGNLHNVAPSLNGAINKGIQQKN